MRLQPAFQVTYTTLFGFHCTFLFLRSSSIVPPILAHIFCNLMGVPRLSAELNWFPEHRRGACLFRFFSGDRLADLPYRHSNRIPAWHFGLRGRDALLVPRRREFLLVVSLVTLMVIVIIVSFIIKGISVDTKRQKHWF
jgi:Type II CAAX prenyl endopeptidase Rce1-like